MTRTPFAFSVVALVSSAACGSIQQPCALDESRCGDTCVNLINDNEHCGACGIACDSGLFCGNGSCAAGCPAGQMACDATCVDTSIDAANCGDCGNACGADQECRNGACEASCTLMLAGPIVDPWGLTWDGVERSALALDAARADCEQFGGRLPTATELYRVSSPRSGAVGGPSDTNPLWSAVPSGWVDQVTIRLSDASTDVARPVDDVAYRCVCGASVAPYFTNNRCNGPAGSACFQLGRINIDADDRPALRASAAMWECANERAHVADPTTLVEAIQAGLGGSEARVRTADRSQYDSSTTLAWRTGTWSLGGNYASVPVTTPAPFRCAGPAFAAGTHPNAVIGEFVGDGGGNKSEATDTPGSGWIAAIDACITRGGHVPRSSELAELVMAGLPAGTHAWMWTTDQCGMFAGTDHLVAALRWTALDPRFPYEYTTDATTTIEWTIKRTGQNASRCIYYPLDPMFTPPASCNGGCFYLPLVPGSGSMPATLYFDRTDRPPSTLEIAFDTCRGLGGHLASERDLTEAIREGLPAGSNTFIWTSEAVRSTQFHIVRWTGVDPAFDDLEPTYASASSITGVRGYRCMWTNEMR